MKTKQEIRELCIEELRKIDNLEYRKRIEKVCVSPRMVEIGWDYAKRENKLVCWLVLELGFIRDKKFGVIYSESGTDEGGFFWSIVDLSDLCFGRYLWFSSLLDAYDEWLTCQGLICPFSPEDVAGAEFEWFAADRNGDIAVFSTAGCGFIPDVVFDVARNHILLEGYLTRTHFEHCVAVPGKGVVLNEYLKGISERGLYAFEWSVWKGPYKLAYIPESPLNITEIDSEIAKILGLLRFEKISWKDSRCINPDEIVIL